MYVIIMFFIFILSSLCYKNKQCGLQGKGFVRFFMQFWRGTAAGQLLSLPGWNLSLKLSFFGTDK